MVSSQVQAVPLMAVEQYLRGVRHTPRIVDEEEIQLLHCIEAGKIERTKWRPDTNVLQRAEQARDRLIEGYQPLLIGLARRYVRNCREMELLDMVQEGNLGLLQALEKYDASTSSASFRTWAFSWVRGTMLIALWQYEGAIRLPLEKVRSIRAMGDVQTRLLSLLHREPTIIEVAHEMDMSEKDVRDLIVLQEQQVVSLRAFPNDDEDDALEDIVADPAASTFFDDDSNELLEHALALLSERERIVINLRYGFEDGQAHTQKEVAALLGVNVSTVAALDRRAQLRLRKSLERRSA